MGDIDKETQQEWHNLARRSFTELARTLVLEGKITGYALSLYSVCDDGEVLYSSEAIASVDEELNMIGRYIARMYRFKTDGQYTQCEACARREFLAALTKIIEREIDREQVDDYGREKSS